MLARLAGAEDWPKGYVPYEDTQSPNERYSILVPTYEAWDSNEASEEVNYFADLKEHRLLGKIKGADYFEHQNHRGLSSVWADDSSWCVTQYDDRFGFSTISVIEPKNTTFIQTDIGARIKKGLAGAIQTNGSEGGDAMAFYRIDSGKLLVRVASTTDPKEMDIKHARYAYFRGTFDVRSKKWISADARRLDYQAYDNASTALMDIDTDEEIPTTSDADGMLESLDRIMNGVYEFLHAVLPPARFAAIKKEQVEWLKKRDAASNVQEKCKLLQGRIKALQDLLW
jgi:uncharacterized protein YecT (DUF1311 family)